MKNIGIWIDKENAIISKSDSEVVGRVQIEEDEFRHDPGRVKVNVGSQKLVNEKKQVEKEKHRNKKFFENIINGLENSEMIVIYGPSEMGTKFQKFLIDTKRPLAQKIQGVFKSDSISENQFRALVRDFYKYV